MSMTTQDISGTDSPTTTDLLGFKRFAKPLALRIANISSKDTPLTIGIYGEWGSGKTSFLKMIDESLREQQIHSVWFNAWKYDHEENLWSALIQTILDQAQVSGSWQRRIWVKLKIWQDSWNFRSGSWEFVKWALAFTLRLAIVCAGLILIFGWPAADTAAFISSILPPGLAIPPLTNPTFQTASVKALIAVITFFAAKPEEWLKLFDAKLRIDFSKLKRSKSYRAHIAFLDEFSTEFKRMVQLIGNGKPLVVVIDDLDRCLPEKAIQVLEAIKLFLDVQGCVFLLAVDRDIVEKAIATKYKDLLPLAIGAGDEPHSLFAVLGENYFEKIVQLPFALPPITDKQFRGFIGNIYDDTRIYQCSDIFFEGLPRNPRKAKRLLQTFLLVLSFGEDGIKNGVLRYSLIAKIVVIQSQYRSIYDDLARFPFLLAELERLYKLQGSNEYYVDTVSDPVLGEKADSTAKRYPALRNILLQKVDDYDTFANVDISIYLTLTESTSDSTKIVEASDPSSDAAVGHYLTSVIDRTQMLSLHTIAPGVISSRKPRIYEVFLTPKVRVYGSQSNHLVADDVLKRSVRSVILGGPGSGKSSLIAFWANNLAQAVLQPETNITADLVGRSEYLLPIVVPLREYRVYAGTTGFEAATPANFLTFIDRYFEGWNIGLPPGFFIDYLERGMCMLLLDGLDEIGAVYRQGAVEAIRQLCYRYPLVRVVVTSRPAAYFPGFGEDFAHYEIVELDYENIAEFVAAWFKVLVNDTTLVAAQTASFLEELQGSEGLLTLAKTPLLLILMVTQYVHRGGLPRQKDILYAGVVDLLLEQWDAARGVERRIDVELFDASRMLRYVKILLAALAFHAHDRGLTLLYESFISDVFEEVLSKLELSSFEIIEYEMWFVTLANERAGIIYAVGDGIYQFAHRILQEYLASIFVSDQADCVGLIVARHQDKSWQDTILLSITQISKKQPARAEHVLEALLSAQTPEGTLLAGQGLCEIAPLRDFTLQNRIIDALQELALEGNLNYPSSEQAETILSALRRRKDGEFYG